MWVVLIQNLRQVHNNLRLICRLRSYNLYQENFQKRNRLTNNLKLGALLVDDVLNTN